MLVKLKKDVCLQDLADLCPEAILNSFARNTNFDSVTSDSREVISGTLFLALGNGCKHISAAIDAGASAVLVFGTEIPSATPFLQLKFSEQILGQIFNYLFSEPSSKLRLIGITGTNGKTSINWMIYQALNMLGSKAMRIGTLGIALPEREFPTDHTTPDILTNYAYLDLARAQQCQNLVMEVSSHALDQGRVAGLDFDIAIYTNLTRDHFDYHQNFENYLAAKTKLFEQLILSNKKHKLAVINFDCPFATKIIKLMEQSGVPLVTYGRNEQAILKIQEGRQTATGAEYCFHYQGQEWRFTSTILGDFNEYNLAVVLAVLRHLVPDQALTILPQIRAVPGRLEPILGKGLSVFVDYAHTPDALENALGTLRKITPIDSKLWVIFGCGGDRDRGKRPIMGKLARDLADRVVVTSDNPRTENPDRIISDIIQVAAPDFCQPDRALAITETLRRAVDGDVILIAGKGHEDYQEINKIKHPFSDQQIVKNYFLSDDEQVDLSS